MCQWANSSVCWYPRLTQNKCQCSHGIFLNAVVADSSYKHLWAIWHNSWLKRPVECTCTEHWRTYTNLLNHQVIFLILRDFDNSGLTDGRGEFSGFPSSWMTLSKGSDVEVVLEVRWTVGAHSWVGLGRSQKWHFDFRLGRQKSHGKIYFIGHPNPQLHCTNLFSSNWLN